MFRTVDPVTYFCRKRELECSSIRQKGSESGSEREGEAGGGGGVSTRRSINRAVSRDAEWKRKRGEGGQERPGRRVKPSIEMKSSE